MTDRRLVFVGPHAGGAIIPSRPAAIWAELARPGVFRSSVRIERRRPDRYLAARLAPPTHEETDAAATHAVQHPWPFGPLERRFLRRLVEQDGGPSALWISDPKSAPVFRDLTAMGKDRCLLVFDAYDAWDLSPLVRGSRRRRAVADGYRAASEHAHVIFANTPFVADRFRRWGARTVALLPNAAPNAPRASKDPRSEEGRSQPPFLLYVGRVHERLGVALLAAVAAAFPDVEIRIAGPIEREPNGWRTFVERPNVHLLGPVPPEAARRLMAAAAACLIPHTVDEYSLSQDAMKAWDALSVGAPVISTRVPPADSWGPELALVADDPPAFIDAVAQVLGGAMAASRARRLAFAADNTWDIRARQAIAVLECALES